MRARWPFLVVGAAGVLLYASAIAVSNVLYPHFWTSSTIYQEVPWYYMGEDFIDGLCAAVALALCAILGALASRKWGPTILGSLIPTSFFLTSSIGEGVAVLLNSRRIWAGPAAASSDWKTFDEYLHGTSVFGYLALGVSFAIVFGFRKVLKGSSAEQPDAADKTGGG
jgi:hypothetical protein